MKKAFFVNIALASILLTSTLLLGATSTRGDREEYDPRADVNNDGVIDVSDLILIAHSLGATGDPNMTSSKFDYEVLYLGRKNATGAGGNSFFGFEGYCGGYSRISITVVPTGQIKETDVDCAFTISLLWFDWSLNLPPIHPFVGFARESPSWSYRVYGIAQEGFVGISSAPDPIFLETKSPYFSITFKANTTHPQPYDFWAVFDFYAYLRNE